METIKKLEEMDNMAKAEELATKTKEAEATAKLVE